jgi:DNA mismatch repair ATPase MutS
MPADSVLQAYQDKLQQIRTGIDRVHSNQSPRMQVLIAALGLGLLLLFNAARWHIPPWRIALLLPVAAWAAWSYARLRREWARLRRLQRYYQRGLERVEDRWQGNGAAGEKFRVADHVYDSDLQILGEGSLFELLCTARTDIGRRRLAAYLLEPVEASESLARQEAVRELKPLGEMRERIALLGEYDFQESSREAFSAWMATPAETAPGWVRLVAFAGSTALAVIFLTGLATNLGFRTLTPWAALALIINMGIAAYFRQRTNSLNAAARRVGVEIAVAREGIQFISGLSFESTKLQEIQRKLVESNAAATLRRLEKLTNAISECDKPFFEIPSYALFIRTQLCFAIEAWKLRHATHLDQWLDAWGEFETLASLSGYAWEHPDDVFPEFHEGPAAFAGRELGIPLLPSETCVRNDVTLDGTNRFYIISGSNMSGKSTLLRTIGLNAILAQAGAPVRAASLRLTKLEVFASLSILDSLLEGRSKFLSEVDRMRRTLEGARRCSTIFLIDEMLSGTNSRDRRVAAELILRALLEQGAIGALSTHDLALTEIAELEGLHGSNVHMGSRSGDDPMDFDYLLKPGITTERNALAIAAMMGLPVIVLPR